MKKRRAGCSLLLAALLLCQLAACGGGGKSPADSGGSVPAKTSSGELAEDSIVSLPGDEDSARLVEDMRAGRLPEKCNVLYDAMGSRPDVTVTDPEQIREIYDCLKRVRFTGEAAVSVTDSYHHVIFYFRDGGAAAYHFLGAGVLERGGKDYAVTGGESLWGLVRELQETRMEEERPT